MPRPLRLASLFVLLAACALPTALPAAAADVPQEDFTGKFICVEDADNSWPLAKARITKIGGKEFVSGDMVPPPETIEKPQDDKDDAKAKPKTKPTPKHRRVLVPLDKVTDIQVFDSEEDLNAYYDSLDDASDGDSNAATVY